MCPLPALQLTPASSRGARPTLTLWVWTCPPTVTPWCTPVSQVISSRGVRSTGSAALTAAGLARCRSAEVRGGQRSDRANDGEDGGGEGRCKVVNVFERTMVHLHKGGGKEGKEKCNELVYMLSISKYILCGYCELS